MVVVDMPSRLTARVLVALRSREPTADDKLYADVHRGQKVEAWVSGAGGSRALALNDWNPADLCRRRSSSSRSAS